jgi:hypothetical protein
MAGSNGSFDANAFRTAIREAMLMGQPNDPADQTTFVWLEKDVFAAEGPGPETDPYDWTATPTSETPAHQTVQVNCAVEFQVGSVDGEPMGAFDASRATLTLLDEDWAQVQAVGPDPDQVLLGGITYVIEPPGAVPSGLFDVTVWQLRVSARA